MEPLRELPHLELQINTRFNKTPYVGIGDDYWKDTYRKGRISRQSKAVPRPRFEPKKDTYPSKVQRYVVTGVSMNVGRKDEIEQQIDHTVQIQKIPRHSHVISRKGDYNILHQNQINTHLEGVLPSNSALIKCSLLNAIESGNYITNGKVVQSQPRRSKSEMKQRSYDTGLRRRSMSRANNYTVESRPRTLAKGNSYRSYHDTEHNQVIPKQFTRDEKVRNWIEYTSFNSVYAMNDISHAWSNKI